MFTVTGSLDIAGMPIVAVTWNAGRLTGDTGAVARIVSVADALDGESVGPIEGRYTGTAKCG